ncbi:unnamed protein product, partial [Candidula unifasciata]
QAILGNLPQRSALASTPFTPASTLKKGYYNPNTQLRPSDLNVTAPASGSLNMTTPALGSRTCRKKLNEYFSPSKKSTPGKMKRSNADATQPESPATQDKPSKSISFFRRMSGSRASK